MAARGAEFEQEFTEVLTSRAVATPRGTVGALDPHPSRRLEQAGRSPPRGHRRDLSQDAKRLPRGPGGLRQQLELHHAARPGRRAKEPSRALKTDRASLRLKRSEGGKTMHPPLSAAAIAVFVIVARLVALE
jgi:hypothetical protein